MLLDRHSPKRGDKRFKFKIPEADTHEKKIPIRLIIGLLTPFVVVTVFLIIFSREDLSSPPASKPVPIVTINKKQAVKNTVPVKPLEAPNQPSLTFFNTLKEAEEPKKTIVKTKKEPAKAIVIQPKIVPAVVKKIDEQPKKRVPLFPPRLKTPVAPAKLAVPLLPPKPVPKPPPSVVAPAVPVAVRLPLGKGDYAIQVGAFPTPDEAGQLAFKLKGRGYSAYVLTGNIPNKGIWYRVRVGHYANRADADAAGKKIAAAESMPFIIVSN